MKDFLFSGDVSAKDKKDFLSHLSKMGFEIINNYGKKELKEEHVNYYVWLGKESNVLNYRKLEYRKDFSESSSISALFNLLKKYGNVSLFIHNDAGLATKQEFEKIKKYLKEQSWYQNEVLTKKFNAHILEVFSHQSFLSDDKIKIDVLLSYLPHINVQKELLETNAYISSLLAVGRNNVFEKLPISYKKLRDFEKSLYSHSMVLNQYDETEDDFKNEVKGFDKVLHCIEFRRVQNEVFIQREFTVGISMPDFTILGIAGYDSSSQRTCHWRIHEERWLDMLPLEKVRTVLYDTNKKRILGIIPGLDERKICILEKDTFGEIFHFPYLKGHISSIPPFYFKTEK